MYKGKVIEFELTNTLIAFVCKTNKHHTVSNVTTVTRKTTFVRSLGDNTCIN